MAALLWPLASVQDDDDDLMMMGMGRGGKKGKKGGGGGGRAGGGGGLQSLGGLGGLGGVGGGLGGARARPAPLALPHSGEVGGSPFRLDRLPASAICGICKVKIR